MASSVSLSRARSALMWVWWHLRTGSLNWRAKTWFVLAVVCLVSWGLAALLWLRASDQLQMARQQQALAMLAKQPPAAAPLAAAPQVPASRAWQQLLLPFDEWTQVLQGILHDAEASRVTVLSSAFREQPDLDAGARRWVMSMQVKGAANDVRLLLLRSMATHPALTIQSLQFRREHDTDAGMDVTIEWLLFLQGSPDGAPQ
jgi:hypothetical protein